MYDSSLKAKWDYENSIAYAEEKAEGRGIEKGEHKKAIAIAIELKKEGLAIEFIAKTTKLSIEEIAGL